MPKSPKKSKSDDNDDRFLHITQRIAELSADKKAKNIKAFDVRGLTLIADSFVLCTATSELQSKAVFNAVKEGLKEEGIAPLRSEGAFRDGWMLIDYGVVIFHIFREKAREFYDLEGMWGDAPEISLPE